MLYFQYVTFSIACHPVCPKLMRPRRERWNYLNSSLKSTLFLCLYSKKFVLWMRQCAVHVKNSIETPWKRGNHFQARDSFYNVVTKSYGFKFLGNRNTSTIIWNNLVISISIFASTALFSNLKFWINLKGDAMTLPWENLVSKNYKVPVVACTMGRDRGRVALFVQ